MYAFDYRPLFPSVFHKKNKNKRKSQQKKRKKFFYELLLPFNLVRADITSQESDALREKDYDETEIEDSISSKTDLRVEDQNEDISYQSIRNVFNTVESTRARYDENQRLINEFRTKPFEELKSRANEKQKRTDQHIEQLLSVRYLPKDEFPIIISSNDATSNEKSQLHMNNFHYPDLFTY